MITKISLVNIYHHIVIHTFFLVMRTFKICSLSKLQIYNTVLLTIVTMLYIPSPGLIYFITKFVPFDHLHPIPPTPTPCLWQPPICSQ